MPDPTLSNPTLAELTDDPAYVNRQDIAAMFGIAVNGGVSKWQDKHRAYPTDQPLPPEVFPRPAYQPSGRPFWLRVDVDTWARTTGRIDLNGNYTTLPFGGSARRVPIDPEPRPYARQVARLAEHGSDLVTMDVIAERLGVTVAAVKGWRSAGRKIRATLTRLGADVPVTVFPEAKPHRLGNRPQWSWPDVVIWAKASGRMTEDGQPVPHKQTPGTGCEPEHWSSGARRLAEAA